MMLTMLHLTYPLVTIIITRKDLNCFCVNCYQVKIMTRLSLQAVGIYFLLLIFLVCVSEATEVSEQKQEEIRRKIAKTRFRNTTTGRDTLQFRRRMPQGQLFGQEFVPLDCGATYSISQEGYVYFDLDSGGKQCHYALLGSRNEECTVAVYCDGQINLAPENSHGCEKEYLILSDGTEGMMSGCGEFNFGKMPRYARNGGKDMYIYIKGEEDSAKCIAYCMEDVKPGDYGLKAPKKIGKNNGHGGQWKETHCKCGIRRDMGRIVGGETALPNEFPWIAGVVYSGTRKIWCGGSLVNDRHVVTAAHCFGHDELQPDEVEVLIHIYVQDRTVNPDSPNQATVGQTPGWDLPPATDRSENTIRRQILDIRVHPMYNEETFDYDIAILTLDQPVNLQDPRITPICLPGIDEDIRYQNEVTMTIAGWGLPHEEAAASARVLQKLDVPYINRRLCEQFTTPSFRHICAGYVEGGHDACSGDSGGPLIYLSDPRTNQYILSGVISSGSGCAREGQLGLYSDVREAVQWLYFHMPGAVWCAR